MFLIHELVSVRVSVRFSKTARAIVFLVSRSLSQTCLEFKLSLKHVKDWQRSQENLAKRCAC